MTEIWRPIAGWPYEASSLGRIRRTLPGNSNRTHAGRVLEPSPGAKGYVRVRLCDDPRRRTITVHSLVCEAFHGPRPTAKHGVAHGNGVRWDNRPENLRWAAQAENNADKPRHGTRSRNAEEAHHFARLDRTIVMQLRRLGRMPIGPEMKALAAQFGVTSEAIRAAINGRTWRYI